MTSKTLQACLVVLASVSMIQATATTTPYYGECLKGPAFVNTALGLRINLGQLLSGILGVAADLINGVLSSVVALVKSVLGTVGTILGGLLGGGTTTGGGDISQIPAPANLGQLIQVTLKLLTVWDKTCATQFGSSWTSGILVDVYLSIANILRVDLDIDGLSILDNALSREEIAAKASQALIKLNLNAQLKTANFLQLSVYLKGLLNLVVDLDVDIDVTTFRSLNLLCLQLEISILTLLGYPDVSTYIAARVNSYNNCVGLLDLDVNIGITIGQAAVTGVPSKCSCLKKYS